MSARAEVWSLDDCIAYAIEHNITVKQQKVNTLAAEQGVTSAKSGYLPNVSANAGQSWTFGRGLNSENIYVNRNNSTFNWGASASVPIFSGMRTTRQVDYAKANLSQVVEQYEAAKEDITINVITGYLQVLYCKEMHELAQSQIELSQYELSRQQALVDAGKIPEVDMLEAKSQLASDQLNATQTLNDLVMARVDLIQLLQLPLEAGQFDVAPLSDEYLLLTPPDEVYAKALQYNHSIQAAKKGINTSDKNISLAKSGYLPSLSFNAGVGSSYYNVNGVKNDPFGDQMRHNFSSYLGFSLNIPIFDGLNTRNSVKRAEIEKVNAQLSLDDAEQKLFRTIQQAYYQAVGSSAKLESSKVAEDAALKSLEAIQEKYNIGRAKPQEFEQAKLKAIRTTAERIQANYELILRSRLLAFYSEPH